MTLGEFIKSHDGDFDFTLQDGDFPLTLEQTRNVLKSYEDRKIESWYYNEMMDVFVIRLEKE